jgi:hypothetical protein
MFETGQNGGKARPAGVGFGFRKVWLICWAAAVVIVALYTGWVFWSRRQENLELQQRIAEKLRAENARAVESLGGNRFEILSFYATPGIIARGEMAQLCYGVSNAKSVSIAPEVGKTWPSASRRLDISPKKDTNYTLTADDGDGHTQTVTLMLRVQ